MSEYAYEHRDKIFEFRKVEKKRLMLSLIITGSVLIIEIIGGIIANSIALLSDAGHMFTHAFAISISLFAIYLANKPTCHHRTFGLYRAEVLAAFVNGLFLLVMVGLILVEAIERLLNPVQIESFFMIFVAIIGLAVNIVSILILQGSNRKSLNVKGVFYHMIGDAISSIGVLIASIVILFTGFTILDPIVSFLIAALIISWAIGILRDSGRILLEMSPSGLNIEIIEDDILSNFSRVKEVFHTHLWTITPDILVLTTHLRLEEDADQDELIEEISSYLFDKFNIIETTLQVTYEEDLKSCKM